MLVGRIHQRWKLHRNSRLLSRCQALLKRFRCYPIFSVSKIPSLDTLFRERGRKCPDFPAADSLQLTKGIFLSLCAGRWNTVRPRENTSRKMDTEGNISERDARPLVYTIVATNILKKRTESGDQNVTMPPISFHIPIIFASAFGRLAIILRSDSDKRSSHPSSGFKERNPVSGEKKWGSNSVHKSNIWSMGMQVKGVTSRCQYSLLGREFFWPMRHFTSEQGSIRMRWEAEDSSLLFHWGLASR